MELTLTGASLHSDTGSNGKDTKVSTSASLPRPSANAKAQSHCQHKHADGQCNAGKQVSFAAKSGTKPPAKACAHSKKPGDKPCCHSHAPQVPSNYVSVESIPVEKLTSNPNIIFNAVIASIKGGPFDTFKYLVDVVLKYEGDCGKPMNWGLPIETPDSENESPSGGCASALGRRSQEGHSLAHWCTKRADVRFLEYLINNVPNISINAPSTDNVGMCPMHWAATEGSIPLVAIILKHLNSVSASTSAPSQTHIATMSSLSADSSSGVRADTNDPVNVRDKSGCTPLLIAAQYGHGDLAAFLIKRGADPNAVDNSQDTALHWAAYKGSVAVCGLLTHLNGIENHLDLADAFGQTPLHLASLRGNVDVVTYLIEEAEGYVERVKMEIGAGQGLQKNGGSLNASHGRILQFPGMLLNLPDRDGKTPVDLAIKKKQTACELELRQHMAKHCNPNQFMWDKIKMTIKPFLSLNSWLNWIGLIQAKGRPPKFIHMFVIINMSLAFLYELIVYASIFSTEQGRLSQYASLHYATIFSFILTWIFFILVHKTDPGILAAATGKSVDGNAKSCGRENKRIRREMNSLSLELRHQYDETLENFASIDSALTNSNYLSLCHSCHIARPYRAKHCRVVNRCVLLFDHHCPFVGATIGLHNYKYFYLFVLTMTLTEFLTGITWILYLKNSVEFEVMPFLIGIYFALYSLMTTALSVFHSQLIKKNLTTNEHQNLRKYKYLHGDDGRYFNPFDKGFIRNLANRFNPGKDSFMIIHSQGSSAALSTTSNKKTDEEERMYLVSNIV